MGVFVRSRLRSVPGVFVRSPVEGGGLGEVLKALKSFGLEYRPVADGVAAHLTKVAPTLIAKL